jgi:drug/metabolite transporter (DMT)-like permease
MTFSLTGGIVVPAIVCWILGYDSFSWIQLISILVIFGSVLMISNKEEDAENKEEFRKHRTFFLIVCTLLGLANGLYGVLLTVQQQVTGVSEKEEMIAVTFVGAALISLVQLIIKEKKNTLQAFRQTKKSLIFLLLTALVSALAINALVIALAFDIDATLVYTFDNAGVLLLSAIASAVFFKEKLSKMNVIGCIIMSAGLICMSQAGNIEAFIKGLFA